MNTSEEIVEIALFPIPGCVCFPMSMQPLHVFEPRYRALVKDSVRLQRRIGICHTEKMVHAAKSDQTIAEILNSNQATYLPQRIFSAGFAEIVEVSPDGRLGVKVEMDQRYELIEEIQTLPYRIVRGRVFLDQPNEQADLKGVRQQISESLLTAYSEGSLADSAPFRAAIVELQKLTDAEFSFKVFSLIRFEPETFQTILQMPSASSRLEYLLSALRR